MEYVCQYPIWPFLLFKVIESFHIHGLHDIFLLHAYQPPNVGVNKPVDVTKQKKRGDSHQSLVPRWGAFALPDDVERATRNPRWCDYTIHHSKGAYTPMARSQWGYIRHTDGCCW